MSDAKQPTEGLAVRRRDFSLLPGTFGEAREMAAMIANSDFAPKDYRGKPENVIIAIQMGADIGLKPMQALQNIAIINGRPSIYGDAALALVMPVLEKFTEYFEGAEGTDQLTAVCIAKRKGWADETKRTFSVADAKAAKLWGKTSSTGQPTPWVLYPKRMLQFRARGFTLRDIGADLLLGLVLAEEAGDYPLNDGNTIQGEVVSGEVVSPIDRVPEEFRDQVAKGFETCKLGAGIQLAKINEFLGGEGVDPKVGAANLVEWLKDEFAKQKSGQPRQKKDGNNGKTTPPASASGDSGHASGQPAGPVVSDAANPTAQPAVEPAKVAPATESVKKRDADLF